MVRNLVVMAICSAAALGCGHAEREEAQQRIRALEEELQEKEAAYVRDLKNRIAATREREEKKNRELEEQQALAEREYRLELGARERRIEEQARRIAELEAALAAQRSVETTETPDEEPAEAGGDVSVRISGVRGESLIVNTLSRPVFVPTAETFKDIYGNEQPVMEEQEETINEYEYHVLFTAENPGEEPIAFTARAGKEEQTFDLEPGASEPCSVPSQRGARLRIEQDGRVQRFPVRYD